MLKSGVERVLLLFGAEIEPLGPFFRYVVQLNGPGNPNLKSVCRQGVWLKIYGHFYALWPVF